MSYIIKPSIVATFYLLFSLTANSQTLSAKDPQFRELLLSIVENKYEVPANQSAYSIVQQLNTLLANPDPKLRDEFAYSIIAVWVGDKEKFSDSQLINLFDIWRSNLKEGIGEANTDSVLKRSFSALCLASLAERDLRKPFLGDTRYRELLLDAESYLNNERDLRGYDDQKGWIHATAHTSDLLKFLVRNPLFKADDQYKFLAAMSTRLSSAPTVYTQGEQGRMARAIASLMMRQDFNLNVFKQWLSEMKQSEKAIFEQKPLLANKLAIYQNNSYFLQALISVISMQKNLSADVSVAKDEILKMLENR